MRIGISPTRPATMSLQPHQQQHHARDQQRPPAIVPQQLEPGRPGQHQRPGVASPGHAAKACSGLVARMKNTISIKVQDHAEGAVDAVFDARVRAVVAHRHFGDARAGTSFGQRRG